MVGRGVGIARCKDCGVDAELFGDDEDRCITCQVKRIEKDLGWECNDGSDLSGGVVV